MKRPILVLAAMRSELRPLTRHRLASSLHTAVTGIGTARAARATAAMLDELSGVERVVMIGIAGGVGSSRVGDLIVPETVIDGATGDALRPEPLGNAQPRGALHTSDAFITDPDQLAALAERGVVALDMETAAVGRVCEERGVPWSVFRGISDHVEHLPVDPAVLALTGAEGEPKAGPVIRYVLTQPGRVPTLARLARGARQAVDASTDALVVALE